MESVCEIEYDDYGRIESGSYLDCDTAGNLICQNGACGGGCQ